MVTCYPSYDMTPPLPSPAQCGAPGGGPGGAPVVSGSAAAHKDYSRPLHVDCSVEYELPDAAKPPAGQRSEPLLMIHPCYYRRAEAQRRTRFVNNLPKSLASPVGAAAACVSSGRRSKVARMTPAPSWSKPAYPAPPQPAIASCYKVAATAECASWAGPAGRTPGHLAPAAPSSAKLDAGAVLSDIIASTCSELNNNYMKQQPQPSSRYERSCAASTAASTTSGSAANSSAAAAVAATAVVSSYQLLPGLPGLPAYHPHLQPLREPLSATAAVDSILKTCQYPGGHHHQASSSSSSSHHHHPNSHHHQASQATQVNRLYGGGLVKAVEPNPELAANPVPAKVRRCGVKRSRSSRAVVGALQALPQDCSVAAGAAGGSTPSWSDMLHLNATATGFSFESPGAGVWGAYGPQPSHGPAGPAGPAPGATPADPLAAWGAMYCREREDDARVLWNSDSLLRLVPV